MIVTISWRGNNIGNSALYPLAKALYTNADIIIIIIIVICIIIIIMQAGCRGQS